MYSPVMLSLVVLIYFIFRCTRQVGLCSQNNNKLRPIPYLRCTTTYTVYMATCNICSNIYIGSTSRQLHYRAREHIAATEKFSDVSALGEHYRKSHSTMKADITFNIIQRTEHDELRLRIVEAYEIQTRRPTLNRNREDLGTGFLA